MYDDLTPEKEGPAPYAHDPPHFHEWSPYFLLHLAWGGNVSAAARYARISRQTAYNHRESNSHFRAAWEEALEVATDRLEEEARRRAVEGVDEPVFYQGKEVARVRKYSDTLLIFLLKAHRPEKYRERYDVTTAGEKVDQVVQIYLPDNGRQAGGQRAGGQQAGDDDD